jgi:uncharacterized protein (TIGR02231 family)
MDADEFVEDVDEDAGIEIDEDGIEQDETTGGTPLLTHPATNVREEPDGNAVFIIPGSTTILSGTPQKPESPNVTIAKFELAAELEWVVVPKRSRNAFLMGRILNDSPYTFLPGMMNIFMGSNFVGKSNIDRVSPREILSCSLGVDPSVKITYHPLIKKNKTTTSGWTGGSPTDSTIFLQRTTIKNNRPAPLPLLIAKDQIPISEDAKVKVKIIEPTALRGKSTAQTVKVKDGVNIRWASGDDAAVERRADHGIFEWVHEGLAAGASVETTLSWEITVPTGVEWEG